MLAHTIYVVSVSPKLSTPVDHFSESLLSICTCWSNRRVLERLRRLAILTWGHRHVFSVARPQLEWQAQQWVSLSVRRLLSLRLTEATDAFLPLKSTSHMSAAPKSWHASYMVVRARVYSSRRHHVCRAPILVQNVNYLKNDSRLPSWSQVEQ